MIRQAVRMFPITLPNPQKKHWKISAEKIVYYPVADDAPLSDYVTLDEHTEFELSDESTITLTFPAGTVTDEANGPQSFRIPLP